MMEEELIKIWRSSSNQEQIKLKKSRLIIELQSSLSRLNRWWNYLELIEVIATVLAIVIFTIIAVCVPFTLSKIAAVCIVVCLMYVLYRIWRIQRCKPNDLGDSYLAYLKKTKGFLMVQKKMLETAFYWYVLPCLLGAVLFVLGAKGVPTHISGFILVVIVLFGVFGYYLNKRRVAMEINPRIRKVDELIEKLLVQ